MKAISGLCLCLAFGLASTASLAGKLAPIALLSIGFKEAEMADFPASPFKDIRRKYPRYCLAETADFTGDGRDDEARILFNKSNGIAHVVIVAQKAEKVETYVLETLSFGEAEKIAIEAVRDKEAALPSLAVASLANGAYRAYRFVSGEFRLVESY